jgi:hypothetical protein
MNRFVCGFERFHTVAAEIVSGMLHVLLGPPKRCNCIADFRMGFRCGSGCGGRMAIPRRRGCGSRCWESQSANQSQKRKRAQNLVLLEKILLVRFSVRTTVNSFDRLIQPRAAVKVFPGAPG